MSEFTREHLAGLEALLARVINSGALTCEQYSELEADICAAVDVVTVLKRLEFKEHLAKCAEEVAAMPTYKCECLKSPAALSATAQPAVAEQSATNDQIAAVMLQHGTQSQQREALQYAAQPAEVKS